jgi:tetratricopeptide (TPR) repeat protein
VKILLERFRYHAGRGEAAEAEAAYADAVKERADDIGFRVQCGDVCAGLQQWAKARDEYARILDSGMLGDGELNRDAWLRLAVLQLHFGDVEDYRRTCGKLTERHGADGNWRTTIALVRLCLLDPDPGVAPDRLAELAKPLPLTPGELRGVHGAALVSLRSGKDDVDVKTLQAALQKYQWDTQRIALARVLHARGDHHRARYHMNGVSVENRRVDPSAARDGRWEFTMEAQLWYRQAEAVIQSGRWRAVDELVRERRWADAIDALAALLKPENRSAIDWGTRATCFAEVGRWSEAFEDSSRANTLAPGYLPGTLKHAVVCLKVGDRDRYVELCRDALARHADATDHETLNSVGWLCALDPAARAESARALALVEKALAGAPVSAHLHTRACLLHRAGRHEDALKQWKELTAQPGYVATAHDWLFLAMTHHHLGQEVEARRYLEQSIAWISANPQRGWEGRVELEHFRAEAEGLIAPSE